MPKTQITRSQLLPLVLLGILAAIIFFAFLGDFSLFNPDEGLYAEPAREMLETGQYITTTLNYAVRFTKPPLVIWAMAFAYKLFGVSEFAARIFCASSGFLLTLATYLFASKYFNKRVAIFASCILLSSPLFIGVGRMAITDMPLSLFIAGSLFSFFHSWQEKKKIWLYTGYVLTAFAIMTKGPVGLLLPTVIMLCFFYLCSTNKETIRFFNLPMGALIIAIIALPWFVIEISITNGAYFQEFIMRENFARFTTVVDSHKGPWFYHLAAVCGGLFPWSIMLPQSLITSVKEIICAINFGVHANSKSNLFFNKYLNCLEQANSTVKALLLALISSLVIVVFFSLSVSKLLPYTLPSFPFLALLISFQWDKIIECKRNKSVLTYGVIISLFYIVAALAAPFALKFLRDAPPSLINLIFCYACLMTVISLACTILAANQKALLSSKLLFGAMAISAALFLPLFLSSVNEFWEADTPQYARLVATSASPLIVYRLRKPAIPFYLGRKAIQANDKEELANISKNSNPCYLITSRKHMSEAELLGFRVLKQKNNFALLTTAK